mmetsp:Transcript_20328/g.29408  ORF Transcript_20328/g.29408 Transcript_20328/m.29408 type:complete len:226 (+) Transcript_20328:97-774(+)|eukprot:CAMPEP_0113952706 /NCGR_PEP_ID=MMETSP1339-20121228/90574_1 /TAXON_ID=94617 /ORGANISM="Fibrocapsa japonica" /LENGTH=225 /DNA_ID=CAMNT_0000961363 /DNA_START=71 /DNA_END=748 /DNA_ORIENTATION=+ /assembly_acc=CAM_ASM_000762
MKSILYSPHFGFLCVFFHQIFSPKNVVAFSPSHGIGGNHYGLSQINAMICGKNIHPHSPLNLAGGTGGYGGETDDEDENEDKQISVPMGREQLEKIFLSPAAEGRGASRIKFRPSDEHVLEMARWGLEMQWRLQEVDPVCDAAGGSGPACAITCKTCKGRGVRKCRFCDGKGLMKFEGHVVHTEGEWSDHGPVAPCSICKSRGVEACRSCCGTGAVGRWVAPEVL